MPILKAGLAHKGFALVDVISPCVTFNDHEGSTKSYLHTRKHQLPIVEADFVPAAREITARTTAGEATTGDDARRERGAAAQGGGRLRSDEPREGVWTYLEEHQSSGEIPMGLLFLDENGVEMHAAAKTVKRPLSQVPYEELCPGNAALRKLQEGYR